MPIYEYKCDKCGVVEVMQGIKEKPLKKCPNCKSKVERQISSTSFVLKGSGWYATDYPHRGAAPKSDKTESKTESKSEGKSESKSDAPASTESKSESKPAAPAKND